MRQGHRRFREAQPRHPRDPAARKAEQEEDRQVHAESGTGLREDRIQGQHSDVAVR